MGVFWASPHPTDEPVTCKTVPNPPYDGDLPDSEQFPVHEAVGSRADQPAGDGPKDPLGYTPAHEEFSAAEPIGEPESPRGKTSSARQHGRRPRRTRRRRWTKRAMIASGIVVLLIVAVGLGGYFYVGYQFNRIPKVKVPTLKKAKPGAPFTVLLAGSDSRSFVKTPGQCKSFGCGADVGGARSDVIILVRVVPAQHKVEMLSIPRDTWVTIPGHVQYISGQNRINAAFNSGSPSLLVSTILQDFHIPINYFVEVNFIGLQNMVNAIGGVHLDFKDPVKDVVTGLRVKFPGCQLVTGVQALALVRSRHLQYKVKGVWYNDYGSDFTRIRNQQTFFRAVIHQLNHEITNPLALNSFINAAVADLTIDSTFTEGLMVSLAREFHSFPAGSLQTVTMPTVGPYITSGGADVLLPAAAADEAVIKNFLSFGESSTKTTTSTTTTTGATSSTSSTTSTTSTSSTSSTSSTTTSTTTASTTTTAPPTSTTTQPKTTTVTTIAPPPSGETPIYNNTIAPYDPTTC